MAHMSASQLQWLRLVGANRCLIDAAAGALPASLALADACLAGAVAEDA